jgi:hypothetical protein
MTAALTRTLAAAPIASLSFAIIVALAATGVRNGLVTDDALRLWAGASTAADGAVPVGRMVAAYPTLPFLSSTLVAWLTPAGTPAPALVAGALFALFAAFCFFSFRKVGLPAVAAAAATFLIAFHPALLRGIVAGPADMFLAVFLLVLCLALYDLRARSGTSEVMAVGLALMGIAFSHPMGAAFAFASVPFLGFAVRPFLVANSALNVVVALMFPTLFAISAFSYVSWIFPGDGWSFFAAPAQSLSIWTVAEARVFGASLGVPLVLSASAAMAIAIVLGAPIAVAMLARVYRRRPLIAPAIVFASTAIAATALSVLSGFFGDPAAIIVAAPVLAAAAVIRIPGTRERPLLAVVLLLFGWLGGFASLALIDPVTASHLRDVTGRGANERADALAAGGATSARDGVLADIENAPAIVLGRGRARGLLGPQSEPFALALLFARIDAAVVAVPDPHSSVGRDDRLNKAFPALFRDGLPDYRVIYQNNTWKIFERANIARK